MFPLVIAAFAGLGVTRLTLLALELAGGQHAEAAGTPGGGEDDEAGMEELRKEAVARVVATMAQMEKPVRLLVRNECQYVCVWQEEDYHAHVSLEELVAASAQRQQELQLRRQEEAAATDGPNALYSSLTAFFDQLVVGKTLEPLLAGQSPQQQRREKEEEQRSRQLRQEEEDYTMQSMLWCGAAASPRPPPRQGEASPSPSSPRCPAAATTGEEDRTCLVCYERARDAVLLTCGHGGTCFACACDVYRRSGECPLCRAPIDQIVTVGPPQPLPNGLAVVPVTGPWSASE